MRKFISSLRFFPKTHDFFGYFERSIENTVNGAKLLCEMIEKRDGRAERLKLLKDYEHIGDKITHEVIDLLRETFLTPFDRMDMYTLSVKMDDILDIIYYIGNRLTRYNIEKMPPGVAALADIVRRSTIEISHAVSGLRNMKNSQTVLDHCVKINTFENEADDKVNLLIEELFGKRWEPIEVIKIKELVENLEAAADKCEDVANVMEGIILKHV
jgi:uncharacterized protein Yka (UPF0111/DUF47 family)